jgi:hypothetical protein
LAAATFGLTAVRASAQTFDRPIGDIRVFARLDYPGHEREPR